MSVLLLPHHSQHPRAFAQTAHRIQIHDYQLYAVQKWLVDRDRTTTLLVVYTGDPAHRISLDAYSTDSQPAWDAAISLLRADGAKPKQTPHGVLMVTSLAHFRSDYTIVQIPDGDFTAAVKDQLYANINLLRMGCSGRTALTLEDPSDTTKERFISTYHLPENTVSIPLPTSAEHLPLPHPTKPSQIGLGRPSNNPAWRSPDRLPNPSTHSLIPSRKEKDKLLHGKTKDRESFVITVLELVKLIQAGLALFGMYGCKDPPPAVSPHLVLDGLLCDDTVDGIRNWIRTIGGPCLGLEPTERIADPAFVAGLLSLVLTIRNKLAALGYSHILPRDPFLYPYAFSLALSSYLQSSSTHQFQFSHHHTFSSPHLSIAHLSHLHPSVIPPAPPPTNIYSAAAAANAAAAYHSAAPPLGSVLSREVVEQISAAYDAKLKADNRKVRRVIKNKLANGAAAAAGGGGGVDSDGADGERERERRNTMSLSLSGGEGAGAANESTHGHGHTLSLAQASSSATVGSAPSSTGIGSSGGQILTGIGNSLASGLGIGLGAAAGAVGVGAGSGRSGSGASADAGSLTVPTVDLASFVGCVGVHGSGDGGHGASKKERKERKSRERARRESVEIGTGYARVREGRAGLPSASAGGDGVAGVARALWSGRVGDVVRMREWDAVDGPGGGPRAVASDGEGEESWRDGQKRYDGRSTEDESDVIASGGSVGRGNHAFGWGGRVRGKLGSWAALGKRKHLSVDLTATSSLNSSLRVPKQRKEPVPPLPSLPKLVIGGGGPLSVQSAGNSGNNYFGSIGSNSSRRPIPSRRATTGTALPQGSRAQSPTLPPMGFSAEPDDDDLLSSGQASPLSDYRPNPFTLDSGPGSSTTQLDEKALSKLLLNPKRPFAIRRLSQTARISSWADPVSARDLDGELDDDPGAPSASGAGDDSTSAQPSPVRRTARHRIDEEDESDVSQLGNAWSPNDAPGALGSKWKRKEKARFHSLLSVVDGEGQLIEKPMADSEDSEDDVEDEEEDEEAKDERRRRTAWFDPRRRRSFHDLETFREVEVLSPERMKIDVELCGQSLIMWRREEHLRNVVTCVRILSGSLSQTNTALREHYESHLDALHHLDIRSKIFSEMDEETHRIDKYSQASNTLRYESAQFSVPDLWQAASPSRRKVFALREKVFGTGGRRLPQGVNGAHGPFNRLLWTLDGQKRLVDNLGRTESEAEEEARFDPTALFTGGMPEEEEEEDVVEHPGIKPMWLLRFFTSWGARWSASSATTATGTANGKAAVAGATPPVVGGGKDDLEKVTASQAGSPSLSPPLPIPIANGVANKSPSIASSSLSDTEKPTTYHDALDDISGVAN